MCERCEELEEEVAYLRSELGLTKNATTTQAIRKRFGFSIAESELAYALYSTTNGLSRPALEELLIRDKAAEYESNTLSVYVSRIRQIAGRDFIETLNGFGYRMSPVGRARIYQALNSQVAA